MSALLAQALMIHCWVVSRCLAPWEPMTFALSSCAQTEGSWATSAKNKEFCIVSKILDTMTILMIPTTAMIKATPKSRAPEFHWEARSASRQSLVMESLALAISTARTLCLVLLRTIALPLRSLRTTGKNMDTQEDGLH
jgi:hypothetical protein